MIASIPSTIAIPAKLPMSKLPLHTEFERYHFQDLIGKVPRENIQEIGEDIIAYYCQQKKVLLMMFYKDEDSEFIIDKNVALESHVLKSRLSTLCNNPSVPRKPIVELLLRILSVLYHHKSYFYALLDTPSERGNIISELLKKIEI